MLTLLIAILGVTAPVAQVPAEICNALIEARPDIAEHGHATCRQVVTEALSEGTDPWLAGAVSWKESRHNMGAEGDGGASYGPLQLHMKWFCNPPTPRHTWRRTAAARAATCDLIGDGVRYLGELAAEPRSRRVTPLKRYLSGPMRIPERYRGLYHAAVVYKGGRKPGEDAHKSGWRVVDHIRDAKKLHARGRALAARP